MIILDTPKYYIISSKDELPELACIGSCKRVWWIEDISQNNSNHNCQWCNGEVEKAETAVHFLILEQRAGPFTPDDLLHLPGKRAAKTQIDESHGQSHVTVSIPKG